MRKMFWLHDISHCFAISSSFPHFTLFATACTALYIPWCRHHQWVCLLLCIFAQWFSINNSLPLMTVSLCVACALLRTVLFSMWWTLLKRQTICHPVANATQRVLNRSLLMAQYILKYAYNCIWIVFTWK